MTMDELRDTQYNLPIGTDMIDRQQAIKALSTITMYKGSIPYNTAVMRIEQLPSAQPDDRLAKIADLVEGTIDHFDLDDAMDLLYQIKEVLK